MAHFIVRYPKSASILDKRATWTQETWTKHCTELTNRLNLHLPREIRAMHLFSYPIHFPPLPFFQARKSAQSKQYSFYIQQGGVFMADWSPFCWFVKEKIGILFDDHDMCPSFILILWKDIEMLKRELATIKGEHDFRNFVNDNKNPPGNTTLTISCIEISILHQLHPSFPTSHLIDQPCANPDSVPAYLAQHKPTQRASADNPPFILRIRIVGSGFLRHMVRRIAGTLQWITIGKLTEGVFVRVMNDGVDSDVHSTKGNEKGTEKEVQDQQKQEQEREQNSNQNTEHKQEVGTENESATETQTIVTNGQEHANQPTQMKAEPLSLLSNPNSNFEELKKMENVNNEKKDTKKRENSSRGNRNKHRLNKVSLGSVFKELLIIL